MSAFVSVPSAPASPPNSRIEHDGWYPGVDANKLRDATRLGSLVAHARLVEAAIGAMIDVGRELAAWKARHVAAGIANLAGIEGQAEVGGEPELVALYCRAVYALTAADLAETHGEISATGEGKDRSEDRALGAGDHRRNAIHAIRRILGAPRTLVGLI